MTDARLGLREFGCQKGQGTQAAGVCDRKIRDRYLGMSWDVGCGILGCRKMQEDAGRFGGKMMEVGGVIVC